MFSFLLFRPQPTTSTLTTETRTSSTLTTETVGYLIACLLAFDLTRSDLLPLF